MLGPWVEVQDAPPPFVRQAGAISGSWLPESRVEWARWTTAAGAAAHACARKPLALPTGHLGLGQEGGEGSGSPPAPLSSFLHVHVVGRAELWASKTQPGCLLGKPLPPPVCSHHSWVPRESNAREGPWPRFTTVPASRASQPISCLLCPLAASCLALGHLRGAQLKRTK